MAIIEKTKDVVKQGLDTYFSDTPKWAKIVRLSGIILTSIGGALAMTNPITAPAGIALLIPYSGYMTVLGSSIAIFVQGFKKN